MVATAYALNATSAGTSDQLGGRPSSFYLDTSADHHAKSGSITFEAPNPGAGTLETIADAGSSGAFTASNSYGAACRLAWGNKGADCSGVLYGGYFCDSSDGYVSYGIYAEGPGYGTFFWRTSSAATGVSARTPDSPHFPSPT